MRRLFGFVFIFLTFVPFGFSQDAIAWVNDYQAASITARETGKPILIDFWADWCGPCKVMDRTFWPRQDVIAESKRFIMVKLDFDKETAVAQRFQASGLPHIVFADPWGNVINRQRGYGSGSDHAVLRKMQQMPGDFNPVAGWLAALAADRGNTSVLESLGNFYRDARAYDLSNTYYQKRMELAESDANAGDVEAFMMKIAGNTFKMQDLSEAQKIYQEVLKRFPEGKLTERAYVGLITCQAFRKKLGDAEKTLETFKTRFPNSALLADAQQPIDQIKRLPTAK